MFDVCVYPLLAQDAVAGTNAGTLFQVGLLITAVAGAVGTLLGVLLTKGSVAYREWAEVRRQDRQLEDDAHSKGYAQLIGELKSRIDALEKALVATQAELRQSQKEHLECIRQHERTVGMQEILTQQMKAANEEIKELRKWRHDMEQGTHMAVLKNAIAAEQAKVTQSQGG